MKTMILTLGLFSAGFASVPSAEAKGCDENQYFRGCFPQGPRWAPTCHCPGRGRRFSLPVKFEDLNFGPAKANSPIAHETCPDEYPDCDL